MIYAVVLNGVAYGPFTDCEQAADWGEEKLFNSGILSLLGEQRNQQMDVLDINDPSTFPVPLNEDDPRIYVLCQGEKPR